MLVGGNPQARPLLEELCGAIGRRGAYALLRVSFEGFLPQSLRWVEEVPLELLAQPAPLFSHEIRTADALIFVSAPDNTRAAAAIETERMGTLQAAYRPDTARMMNHDVPWVVCQYPTAALAQEAGLGSEAFAELLYGAVLRDWAAEGERMRRVSAHFDAASEIRIVGTGTDLRLSLEGRTMRVDALGANLPGGEFFGCPVEDSAEGEISFGDFPAVYRGREVAGIRLAFAGGVVVDASAEIERGLPAPDARHRRGRAPPRRARDRVQPRHHPVHEEHALRREDGRHRPPRAREQLHRPRRRQQVGHPLGPGQGPAAARLPDRARRRVVQQDGAWLV